MAGVFRNIRMGSVTGLPAHYLFVDTVDLTDDNSDQGTITIPADIAARGYFVEEVTFMNASASLAAIAALVGLYTAAAGGGSEIVAPAVVTGLTGTTVKVNQTVAVTTKLTGTSLVVRVTTAGASGTLSVRVKITPA